MNKAYRQGQIVKLIRAKRIHTQDELAGELAKVGVEATQVTLSRDMRELRLAKTAEGYTQVVTEPAGPDLATVVSELLSDARVAQNLLVLKTSPGHANSLAVALDRAEWPEVVGTIAGDDTVLVIAPDHGTAEKVRKRLIDLT